MSKNIIHFGTKEAAALFEHEIMGQLSDGMWENTRPLDHWRFWHDSEIIVDGKVGYERLSYKYVIIKNNYNISALKQYVGDRMQAIVTAAKMNKNPELAEYIINERLRNALKKDPSDYWHKKAIEVKDEFGEDFDKAAEELKANIDHKDLDKAIKEIKLMFKTRLN